MKNMFIAVSVLMTGLCADSNTTVKKTVTSKTEITKTKQESNTSQKDPKKIEEKIKRQMEKEKKYAQEQKFYQADQYDFKGAEVDPETLKKVKAIEPDYDFDITDVYRDDI